MDDVAAEYVFRTWRPLWVTWSARPAGWDYGPMKGARRKKTSTILGEGRCTLCGGTLTLVTSRKVRGGAAWLNPRWNAEVEVHEVCSACGARLQIYQTNATQ